MSNAIDHPDHYTQGGTECIEAIQSALTPEQFIGFLRGQVIKYAWRADHKGNAIEDLMKADWYLKRELATRVASAVAK